MLAIDLLKESRMLDPDYRAKPLGGGVPCTLEYLLDKDTKSVLAAKPGDPLYGVDEEVLQMLARYSTVMEVENGVAVQQQDEQAVHVVFIVSASVAIIHHVEPDSAAGKGSSKPFAKVVDVSGQGSTIGDAELLAKCELSKEVHGVMTGNYRATGLVVKKGTIIRCTSPGFILDDPKAYRLLANLGARVAQTLFARQTTMEHLSVEEKIQDVLRHLAVLRKPLPHEVPGWFRFNPKLTVDELRGLVGLSSSQNESVRLAVKSLAADAYGPSGDYSSPNISILGYVKRTGVLIPSSLVESANYSLYPQDSPERENAIGDPDRLETNAYPSGFGEGELGFQA